MTATDPVIREVGARELDAVLALYPKAFPDEDLRSLVTALATGTADTVSLAAFAGGEPVGHAVFTLFDGGASTHDGRGALLGPLGVHPAWQQRGIGTSLVRDGLSRLAASGVRQVFVLGDPGYYARHGFGAETRIRPPYELPGEWNGTWQSLALKGAAPLAGERIHLPVEWMDPALWRP